MTTTPLMPGLAPAGPSASTAPAVPSGPGGQPGQDAAAQEFLALVTTALAGGDAEPAPAVAEAAAEPLAETPAANPTDVEVPLPGGPVEDAEGAEVTATGATAGTGTTAGTVVPPIEETALAGAEPADETTPATLALGLVPPALLAALTAHQAGLAAPVLVPSPLPQGQPTGAVATTADPATGPAGDPVASAHAADPEPLAMPAAAPAAVSTATPTPTPTPTAETAPVLTPALADTADVADAPTDAPTGAPVSTADVSARTPDAADGPAGPVTPGPADPGTADAGTATPSAPASPDAAAVGTERRDPASTAPPTEVSGGTGTEASADRSRAAEPASAPASAPAAPAGATTSTSPLAPSGPAAVATPSASPSLPTGTSAAVARQVFPEITRLAKAGEGTHRVTLELNPGALGDVRVTLTVRGGEMRVHIAAGDAAQAALAEGAPELHRLLEAAGATDTRLVLRDLAGTGNAAMTQASTAQTAPSRADQHGTDLTQQGQPGHHDFGAPHGERREHHAGTRGGSTARDGITTRDQATRPGAHETVMSSTRAGAGLDVTV